MTSLLLPILLQIVPFKSVETIIDQHQGTAECVDSIEETYGEFTLVSSGTALYTVSNICDFE